jgi:hypothetical protein
MSRQGERRREEERARLLAEIEAAEETGTSALALSASLIRIASSTLTNAHGGQIEPSALTCSPWRRNRLRAGQGRGRPG